MLTLMTGFVVQGHIFILRMDAIDNQLHKVENKAKQLHNLKSNCLKY